MEEFIAILFGVAGIYLLVGIVLLIPFHHVVRSIGQPLTTNSVTVGQSSVARR